MGGRGITRRSLLAGTAGALAGGLLRQGGAFGLLLGPPRPALSERLLGRVGPGGATVELASPADLVGLAWQAPARARVWLRFRDQGARWSGWVQAGSNGHGPEAGPGTDRPVGDPIWTGGASAVQVRATPALHGARLHLVDVSGGVGAARRAWMASAPARTTALHMATPILGAGPGQPPIIARQAWAQRMSPPRVAPAYGTVRMAFVHHTENPNGYTSGEVPAMLRAIYVYHRYVKGWDDIGYNFVVDLYGRIFEARAGGIDEPVVGAHAGGYNLVSTGAAVLGSFTAVPVSAPARRALEALLAWKLSLHGVPAEGRVTVRVNPAGASFSRFPANALVPLPRIAGHRDGDSTDCPGDALYGELPAIRRAVRRSAPNPTKATLALASAPVAVPGAPGSPASTGTGAPAPGAGSGEAETLAGRVERLDGTAISGAPVLVQARAVSHKGEVVGERTLAQATTDSEGRWSLPVSQVVKKGGTMWLRALCPGGTGFGASVSDQLHVAVTPAPATTAPSAPATPVAAPPAS